MSDAENSQQVVQGQEKILVFNPGGFIMKLIFAIGVPIYLLVSAGIEPGLKGIFGFIFNFLVLFVVLYFIATVFGFAVRVTGNYIIGGIIFLVLLAVFFGVVTKVEEALMRLGAIGEFISQIGIIALLIWPVVKDVKKAIVYFKNVV